jgi:signal transduction histidine kinase
VVTPILKRMQPQRPHLAALVVLLVLSFGLTLSLAWAAWAAARRAELQARSTVDGWAALAVAGWKERIEGGQYGAIAYAFHRVVGAHAESPSGLKLAPQVVRELIEFPALCACLRSEHVRFVFRVDLRESGFAADVAEVPPAVRAWLRQRLQTTSGAVASPDGRSSVGIVTGKVGGVEHAAYFFKAYADSVAHVAYGLLVDPQVIRQSVNLMWQGMPLLPQAWNANAVNDSLLSTIVMDGGGVALFNSPMSYDTTYHASLRLGGPFQGRVDVSIRPDATEALIPGGIPRPPHGLLFGLLMVSGLLIVSAMVLIRREADLARLRADFIAGVSHELRTPLAQIRMFAETLLLGRVRSEAERTRSLEIIDQEARRLAHLVENVLIFAKSERRKSRINPQLADLPADIRAAVQGFAVLSRSRQIEVRTELQEGVTAPVDRGALRQVLLNLLDNAVKYGPLEQRITVGMGLFDNAARIWIDDEGPGIPAADRDRVFGRFFRLSRDVDSPIGGSGIGLAIVRELVLLHGGRVWVEDAPGRGARVVVEFPGAYVRPDSTAGGWAVA